MVASLLFYAVYCLSSFAWLCRAALPPNFFLDIDGISVSLGVSHLCTLEVVPGIELGGRPRCWGYDEEFLDNFESALKEPLIQIVSGHTFTCGLSILQTVHCWGMYLPDHLADIKGLYTQISAGRRFVCGVMTDGRIGCTGYNDGARNHPRDHHEKFVQISCLFDYCCALDTLGHAKCWGGDRNPHVISPPKVHRIVSPDGKETEVIKHSYKKKRLKKKHADEEDGDILTTGHVTEAVFKQVSVGWDFACGILYASSDLFCWGESHIKSFFKDTVPGPFKQVSVGKLGVCAIRADDDRLQCFGQALHDRLGADSLAYEEKYDQVKVGFLTMCAVGLDSSLNCWGGNYERRYDVVVA